MYQDLRSEYAKYAKVFPFAKSLGYKVPSKWYRRGVGAVEIGCGEKNFETEMIFQERIIRMTLLVLSGLVLLLIPNRKIKKAANIVLLLTKVILVLSGLLLCCAA